VKPHLKIIPLLLLAWLVTSCYHNIIPNSSRTPNREEIEKEIYTSYDHPKDNRNYKVILKNGDSFKFCCIDHIEGDVVFFNKLLKEKDEWFYEPHGFYIQDIKSIRYWDGTTFGDAMMEVLDAAIEEL
jgi:hypothetical protein